MMQSIDTGSAPNGASGAAQPAPKSTTDSLVDSALDALGDLAGPDAEPTRREKRPERHTPDAPERDGEDEQPLPGDGEEAGAEDEDEAAHEDDVEEHDTRGSKEEPFSVKDLPSDKFIELKVDGEKVIVPLSELARGYVSEKTFHQRIGKTKALADEATAHLTRLKETEHNLREATRTLLSDPNEILEYFTATEEREAVLMQVAQAFAAQVRKFREDPQSRIEYERQRNARRLQEERERWQAQKEAEQQAEQARAQQERFEKVFKPGWEQGLKKAGFPDVAGEQGKALFEEVMVRLNQRHQTGKPISSDDVAEFVHRAAKLLELPPRNQGKKPKPAPVAPPREKLTRGRDPWADKPRTARRNDPDYFLKNLRPKDFR